jgi:hypothetical protein
MIKRTRQFRLRGRVSIYSLDEWGGKILVRRSNIITNLGKQRAAELLGGIDAAFVSRCQVGDGGTNGVALDIPIAPADTDVSLVNLLQDETIVSAVVAPGPPVTLTLSTNFFTANPNINPFLTANEVASEAGLVTQDNILFARTTFPSIPFNPPSRTGLVVVWEIEIV